MQRALHIYQLAHAHTRNGPSLDILGGWHLEPPQKLDTSPATPASCAGISNPTTAVQCHVKPYKLQLQPPGPTHLYPLYLRASAAYTNQRMEPDQAAPTSTPALAVAP